MSLAHLFPFMYICIYVIRCVVWHKEIKNLNLNLKMESRCPSGEMTCAYSNAVDSDAVRVLSVSKDNRSIVECRNG